MIPLFLLKPAPTDLYAEAERKQIQIPNNDPSLFLLLKSAPTDLYTEDWREETKIRRNKSTQILQIL